jgi:hypothetical protein
MQNSAKAPKSLTRLNVKSNTPLTPWWKNFEKVIRL